MLKPSFLKNCFTVNHQFYLHQTGALFGRYVSVRYTPPTFVVIMCKWNLPLSFWSKCMTDIFVDRKSIIPVVKQHEHESF